MTTSVSMDADADDRADRRHQRDVRAVRRREVEIVRVTLFSEIRETRHSHRARGRIVLDIAFYDVDVAGGVSATWRACTWHRYATS